MNAVKHDKPKLRPWGAGYLAPGRDEGATRGYGEQLIALLQEPREKAVLRASSTVILRGILREQ
jgi:hypothetical protein